MNDWISSIVYWMKNKRGRKADKVLYVCSKHIKAWYRSAVVEGVLENTSGCYSAGSLHAVSHRSRIGEVWELLANVHKLGELRLGSIRVLVAYQDSYVHPKTGFSI